jgi:hypothetical protein
MPTDLDRRHEEVITTVRRMLQRTFEGAAEAAQSSRNAVGLAADIVALRRQLAVLLDFLRSRPSEREDAVAAVWTLVHQRPEALDTESRARVVSSWTRLLVEGAEKIDRDEYWASRYAAAHDEEEEALIAGASRSASAALRDL